MKFIDTHSHLYLPQFSEDISACINRAIENGVEKIILPNIDSESIVPMLKLAKEYPENCFSLMGLHPAHIKENFEQELAVVLNELETNNYLGVGEIGIDLYWDKTFFEEQKLAFETQVNFALKDDLPLVIHARESMKEIIDVLKSINSKRYKGVFHAFSGTKSQAQQVIEMGFYIGIGGVVTYKNSDLPEIIADIDLRNIVLETDSPFLTPAPHRGKRNESSYIPIIAEKISSIYKVSIEEVAEQTTNNAVQLFNL